jgi:hypothetical protein
MDAPSAPRNSGAALLERIAYRHISASDQRDALFRMRYRAYLEAGLIDPSADGRVFDHYEDAPDTWTFGIDLDGELCASIRLHVLSMHARSGYTPAIYGDVLDPLLDRGQVFVDASRFVVDPRHSTRHPDLALLTLRLAYVACDHFAADTGIAMIREDHEAFYRRFFRHEKIAGPRPFPGWPTRKNVLMFSDFRGRREAVMARFPVMESTASERCRLFGTPGGRPAGSELLPAEAAE